MENELLEGLDEVIEAPVDHEPAKEPEAKEPEAKAPEAKSPEKVEAKEEEPTKKTMPLAAYLEDKRKWKEEQERTAGEVKALREQLEALKNPPKQPAAEPEFTQDPKGYVDHRVQGALEKLEAAGKQVETVQKTAQQAAAEAQMTRFMSDLTTLEGQYIQATPDYYDALNHIRSARASQLRTLVPEITDDQVAQQIRKEELQMASQLMQQGRNPHEYAYKLAATYGYQKKAETIALPDVKKTQTLAPDKTLGTSGGNADEQDIEAAKDPIDIALESLFRKRA